MESRARRFFLAPFLSAFILCSSVLCTAASADPNHAEIFEMARAANPEAYDYAMKNKVEVISTDDARTFLLWWQPLGFDFKNDTVIVSLGGTGGWATKDFEVWHSRIKDRGYAILNVQWWYGRSQEMHGYARPREIYEWVTAELERRAIPRGHVIFQGFSRGSANSYAVTFQDRKQKTPYFALTIANSGALEPDYPPNKVFLQGEYGAKPFAGSRWILYCSENDEEHPDSCAKTDATKSLLEAHGGKVDELIRDSAGGHGGFMNPRVLDPALDAADRIVSEQKPN